jgi:hypothetical protein
MRPAPKLCPDVPFEDISLFYAPSCVSLGTFPMRGFTRRVKRSGERLALSPGSTTACSRCRIFPWRVRATRKKIGWRPPLQIDALNSRRRSRGIEGSAKSPRSSKIEASLPVRNRPAIQTSFDCGAVHRAPKTPISGRRGPSDPHLSMDFLHREHRLPQSRFV